MPIFVVDPMTELVYGEFLEALARLARARYREKLGLNVKLDRLFDEVCRCELNPESILIQLTNRFFIGAIQERQLHNPQRN